MQTASRERPDPIRLYGSLGGVSPAPMTASGPDVPKIPGEAAGQECVVLRSRTISILEYTASAIGLQAIAVDAAVRNSPAVVASKRQSVTIQSKMILMSEYDQGGNIVNV